MKLLLSLLLMASPGWAPLFNGKTLQGWTPEMAAQWHVADGAIVADAGGYGWLRSAKTYSDFELKCDFRTAAGGNSGIFLRSAKDGNPHETGYELQIFDQHPQYPTGSFVGHVAASAKVPIKPNQWQTYDVLAKGDQFVIKLDGKMVLDTRQNKSASGYIGLQYNPGKKIEFRNIQVRPL